MQKGASPLRTDDITLPDLPFQIAARWSRQRKSPARLAEPAVTSRLQHGERIERRGALEGEADCA